ncbi:MAG: SH3 domain-containing protein [Oscillospiraceae bacterium]|nr:SH3 domain-containing protein [Oscillospiraceae bacterium]
MKKTGICTALALAVMMCTGASAECADINDYVREPHNVSYAMTSPAYWTERTSGDIIRTPGQIAGFNEENPILLGDMSEGDMSLYDLGDTISGSRVRELVNGVTSPDDPSSCYVGGKPTTEAYWEGLKEKLNSDAVPDTVRIRYGFSTERASLRIYPSADFVGEDKGDRFYDVMVMSEYMPFQPLAAVHETADGEWLYVLFDGFGGWVQKKYVAFCESREDWLSRCEPDDFLVVTGREIRLQYDEKCKALSNQLIPMGTKLPLVKKKAVPRFINDRDTAGCYIVKLPVRNSDGMIADRYSLISVREDVNIGYLDYTDRNVLELAMKRYGDRYGWAGLGHSNDCSGVTGEIYRCFGIKLPRVSSQIAAVKGTKNYDVREFTDEQKTELLSTVPTGAVLYLKGHIMIYLGMKDGAPYCISAAGTYYDADGNVYDVNCVTINDMSETYRKNGNSWLTELAEIVVV